jgi:hypothetical protein
MSGNKKEQEPNENKRYGVRKGLKSISSPSPGEDKEPAPDLIRGGGAQ